MGKPFNQLGRLAKTCSSAVVSSRAKVATQICPRVQVPWRGIPRKETGTGRPLQRRLLILHLKPCALTQTNDRHLGMEQHELLNPLFPRLAHVTIRVGVEIVWVDLSPDEAKCLEGRRLDDRHVIGRAQSRRGNVGTGTPAQVGRASHRFFPDGIHQPEGMQVVYQLERVATTYTDGIGVLYGVEWILKAVYTLNLVCRQTTGYHLLIIVVGKTDRSVGNEYNPAPLASEQPLHTRRGMLQVAGIPGAGCGQQEVFAGHFTGSFRGVEDRHEGRSNGSDTRSNQEFDVPVWNTEHRGKALLRQVLAIDIRSVA